MSRKTQGGLNYGENLRYAPRAPRGDGYASGTKCMKEEIGNEKCVDRLCQSNR